MRMRYFASMGFVLVGGWISGCAKSDSPAPAAGGAPPEAASALAAEHAHGTGPNGGVVFDLGSHHAEFTVDHGKHECAVLILGDDEKTPKSVAAVEFVLNTKETKTADGTVVPPMTITMSPQDAVDGKASVFVGTDPGIGSVADFAGSVTGEVEGKPAMGEFQE